MKITSGGQTGADRAALDVALSKGLAYGGSIPKGRRAEDGAIPAKYEALTELNSNQYLKRTEKNVVDADATLIFTRGNINGGTPATLEFAKKHVKPYLVIDLQDLTQENAVDVIVKWLHDVQPGVLNVAGPRESDASGIYGQVFEVLADSVNLLPGNS